MGPAEMMRTPSRSHASGIVVLRLGLPPSSSPSTSAGYGPPGAAAHPVGTKAMARAGRPAGRGVDGGCAGTTPSAKTARSRGPPPDAAVLVAGDLPVIGEDEDVVLVLGESLDDAPS